MHRNWLRDLSEEQRIYPCLYIHAHAKLRADTGLLAEPPNQRGKRILKDEQIC